MRSRTPERRLETAPATKAVLGMLPTREFHGGGEWATPRQPEMQDLEVAERLGHHFGRLAAPLGRGFDAPAESAIQARLEDVELAPPVRKSNPSAGHGTVIQCFYVECDDKDPDRYGTFTDTETDEVISYKWIKGTRDEKRYVESDRNSRTGWTFRNLYKELGDEQIGAREQVDLSTIPEEHKLRAKDLIASPVLLNQSVFGVCGLTSLLNVMVRENPQEFVRLALDTFESNLSATEERYQKGCEQARQKCYKLVLVKLAGESEDDMDKRTLEQLETEYKKFIDSKPPNLSKIKQYVDEREKSIAGSPFLDFAMSQYLIGRMEVERKVVFEEQVKFNEEFPKTAWREGGHFAMTEKGLQYVAETLMGAKGSDTIRVKDLGVDYAAIKNSSGSSGAVLAAVTATDFYQKKDKKPVEDASKSSGSPAFVHWVIVEDVKKDDSSKLPKSEQPTKTSGKYYALKIWTWAKHFFARVMESVTSSYIYSLVTGKFR